MKKIVILFIFWALLIVVGCNQDKLPLPVPRVQNASFGANDTNYVELSPVWNAQNLGYQFSHPEDITIGPDGIIFVADKGNDRVVALSKAGNILTSHGLGSITGIPHPYGVAIDSKLNLLIANGSDTLYCWNQFLNYTEIDSIADEAVLFDPAKNDTVLINFKKYLQQVQSGQPRLDFRHFVFRKDPALVEKVRRIYPIYVAGNGAQLNGVAAGPFGSGIIYVTESEYDKISEITLVPQIAVKTDYGASLFQYTGIRTKDIATFGSGAGTVDDPWGITTDKEGDIYFTQLGGNFRVQKLDGKSFKPVYVLYQDAIMDLNRFMMPTDITLDGLENIFVIDTQAKTVSKFANTGANAGQVLSLGKRGLATEEFNDARGIMVDDNIVYVVESGENRIRRFQYSVSESDIPDKENQP